MSRFTSDIPDPGQVGREIFEGGDPLLPPELFAYDYPPGTERVKAPPTVWAAVNLETGEVDRDVQEFDDELYQLSKGWAWFEFTLVPTSRSR